MQLTEDNFDLSALGAFYWSWKGLPCDRSDHHDPHDVSHHHHHRQPHHRSHSEQLEVGYY